ncbi:MAG TPA: quinone oxidoreductase [Gemmatales bacterium]|nr:quinone oxidoreductase [Gemmatales bacterium]
MQALTFDRFGGPEVLRYQEVPDPIVPPGHALVRLHAIGLNFADIYRRRGNYHLIGQPPYIAGYEGAGTILTAPSNSLNFLPGGRVAFADIPLANAELVAAPLEKLIPLPEDISFDTAAALLLQGLTAHYLVRDSYAVQPSDEVLVHAAAGGVGLLLIQMVKQLGGRVFGLASTAAKQAAALEAGAEAAASPADNWVEAVKTWSSKGKGVSVAYDSVGSTLEQSLRATRTGGHVVFYGMAGGEPPLIKPRQLMDESKSITGGDLWNVLTNHDERLNRAHELFAQVRSASLTVRIARRFPLTQGVQAHAVLESRECIGKVLLIP